MSILNWFRDRMKLIRRITHLEATIIEVANELQDKRIMFEERLSPDYILFLAGIIKQLRESL